MGAALINNEAIISMSSNNHTSRPDGSAVFAIKDFRNFCHTRYDIGCPSCPFQEARPVSLLPIRCAHTYISVGRHVPFATISRITRLKKIISLEENAVLLHGKITACRRSNDFRSGRLTSTLTHLSNCHTPNPIIVYVEMRIACCK